MKRKLFAFLLALSLALSLLPAAALADETAEKEQIYWAVMDTNGDSTADKLIISSAEQTDTCVAKGSFDYDAVFEKRDNVPWKYKTYSGITTAVIEASNGRMVAPVSTKYWFDHTGIPANMQKLTSIDLNGLSGERLENMRGMFLQAHQLSTISFPKDFDTSHVTDMSEMFSWTGNLTRITGLANWNTSNVTTMESMFNRSENLTEIDSVANWDTSNVTNMKWLFNRCHKLQSVDVSNWNTSRVTNMQQVFNRCLSLEKIDVSKWDTSNVTDMQMMFKSCTKLKALDLSNWDTSKVTTMVQMFYMEHGSNLEEIKGLEDFDLSSVKNATGMFMNCSELAVLALDTSTLSNEAGKTDFDKGLNSNAIRIIANGGRFMDGTAIDDGKLDTPIKDGYAFGGWYTDEACENKFEGTPAGGSTYYAKWSKDTNDSIADPQYKNIDLGTIMEGGYTSAAAAFTGTDALTAAQSDKGYFTASVSGMNVIIAPQSNLKPGTYRDIVYVYTATGAVHFIYVTLTVTEYVYIPVLPSVPSYPVTVEDAVNGTVKADRANAAAGSTVTITVAADKDYLLGGLAVTDAQGSELKLTDLGGGKYSFVMPASKVTVRAVFAAEVWANPYPDVKETDWFFDAVKYVTVKGLMTGTDKGFEPELTTSRAMIWTVLARMSGVNATASGSEWYVPAQQWAVTNGVSDGTAPNSPVTREQLAAMLYRYAMGKGLVKADAAADLSVFADAASVSPYAREAMQWAVAVGLVNGMDGKLNPQGLATRAQTATMLMRLCEMLAR